MRLSMARLLELSMLGISGDAFRLYVTAYTRANEAGVRVLSCAAMANLPGAPRNSKALGKLLLELIAHGLVIDGSGSYEVPEVLSAAATRMRRVRSEPDGTNGEHVRESFSQVSPNNGRTASNVPSLDLPDQDLVSVGISESSSLLSSDPKGPVSKRARVRRVRFVPEDWAPKEQHFEFVRAHGLDMDTELRKFRNNEFNRPYSEWDRVFTSWLDKALEFGRGKRPATPAAGSNFARLKARAEQLELEEKRNAAQ